MHALSKAVAMQCVRNLAVEHGEKNAGVDTVAPGLTRTEMAA